ncbi:MAG: alpha/beta hydrolase [Candidatus Helarchaeota archaeon]|nr:alpha/beta hydrolase [Candidatus Helarchaeota archaeon]
MFKIILITGGGVAFLIIIDLIISFKQYQKDLSFWKNKLKSYKTEAMETQYGKIEYLKTGKDVPILVSHGINGGFDQGLGLSELYIGNDYEIIAPSRFGYLGTPLPENSTPDVQADAYAALLDRLGIEKVYMFGNSAGGTSAIQFALRYPDRCVGLILLSSNVPSNETLPPKPVMRMIFGSNYLYWKIVSTFSKTMLSMFIPKNVKSQLSDEKINKIINNILLAGLPIDQRTAGFINDMYISNPDINNEYPFSDIKIPTLIIHAIDNPAPPYEGAKKISKEMPNAKLVSFDTGGHLLIGHEKKIRKEIHNFIEELEKG